MTQNQTPEIPPSQAGFSNAHNILVDAPIGIFISTPEGRFNIWHDPHDRQKLLRLLRAHGVCENLEAQFRRKNGSITTALMSARIISIKGIPHIISITKDIFQIKQAVQEMLQAKEQAQPKPPTRQSPSSWPT